MKTYYLDVVRSTEVTYEEKTKQLRTIGKGIKGIFGREGIANTKDTANYIHISLSLYVTKESRYYKETKILEDVKEELSFLRAYQRETGLFDLTNCNFNSAPDTGFLLGWLYKAHDVIQDNKELQDIKNELLTIIEKGMDGMVKGGFHTPNHRWEIASILLRGYEIFHKEVYKTCAESYLIEGIDNTEDGEYAERSAGNYNHVNNEAMIALYFSTKDEQYLVYPERNLKMMMSYIDPDGCIFTNNSTRQDRGTRQLPTIYFSEYLKLGVWRNNEELLKQAGYIWELCCKKGARLPDNLSDFICYPELKEVVPVFKEGEYAYHHFFKDSGIVRVRENDFGYTLMENSSNFLYFQVGELVMSMKIGVSICQHRHFITKKIEETKEGYCMQCKLAGWYYLPFGKACDTTDWWKMPNDQREQLYGPEIDMTVHVIKKEEGVDVKIVCEGIDQAPLRVEFGFDESDECILQSGIIKAQKGGIVTAKEGMATVVKGNDQISVGPAFYAHNYIDGKFNSEGRDSSLFYVFFTEDTPFEHTIKIRK